MTRKPPNDWISIFVAELRSQILMRNAEIPEQRIDYVFDRHRFTLQHAGRYVRIRWRDSETYDLSAGTLDKGTVRLRHIDTWQQTADGQHVNSESSGVQYDVHEACAAFLGLVP